MNITKREKKTLNGRAPGGPELKRAIRSYVRTFVLWHGRQQTAQVLGVSRHTLWRFLERGHMGRAVPNVVLNAIGGNVEAVEAATQRLVVSEVALNAAGYTGAGVKVGVIDGGFGGFKQL